LTAGGELAPYDGYSDTQRLAKAVTALAATLTEILTERVRELGEIQERRIALKTTETLMTRREAAAHFRVAVRTMENWTRKGYVPYYKLGKVVLYKLSDIEQHWDQKFRVARRGLRR
jgi:excisionase family DNA binding protein